MQSHVCHNKDADQSKMVFFKHTAMYDWFTSIEAKCFWATNVHSFLIKCVAGKVKVMLDTVRSQCICLDIKSLGVFGQEVTWEFCKETAMSSCLTEQYIRSLFKEKMSLKEKKVSLSLFCSDSFS